MTGLGRLGRGSFAAMVACALALGAAQAVAAPPAPSRDAAICYSGACYRECKENGWRGGGCRDGGCYCWE
jgi:hypothetical protein